MVQSKMNASISDSSRQTEENLTRNNLVEVLNGLSGVSLNEEQQGELLDAMVGNGVRSKEAVKRISNSSYSQGQASGVESNSGTINELKEQLSALEGKINTPREVPSRESAGTTATDPVLSAMSEQISSLASKLESMDETNKQLRVEAENRNRASIITEAIAKKGISEANSVLLLIRSQEGVDFVPDPANPTAMIAVRADDNTMPIDGPGARTSMDEWIDGWKATDMGKRFQSASQSATGGAGIVGGTAPPEPRGVLSQEAKRQSLEKLGIIVNQ